MINLSYTWFIFPYLLSPLASLLTLIVYRSAFAAGKILCKYFEGASFLLLKLFDFGTSNVDSPYEEDDVDSISTTMTDDTQTGGNKLSASDLKVTLYIWANLVYETMSKWRQNSTIKSFAFIYWKVIEERGNMVIAHFLFSIVWSVAAAVEEASRDRQE